MDLLVQLILKWIKAETIIINKPMIGFKIRSSVNLELVTTIKAGT